MAEVTQSYCNYCTGYRRHNILHQEKTSWNDEIILTHMGFDEENDTFEEIEEHRQIEGSNIYEIVKCCGCEHISMRHITTFSEDCDQEGNPIIHTSYYPPAIFRKKPQWMAEFEVFGGFIPEVINEIYIALQNDSYKLAAMGIRALLETVMIENVGDNDSFTKNLNKFMEKGFISKIQKNALEPIIEAGHATIHRSFSPTKQDLIILVDIVESILEAVYINERKAKRVEKNVPPRKNKHN